MGKVHFSAGRDPMFRSAAYPCCGSTEYLLWNESADPVRQCGFQERVYCTEDPNKVTCLHPACVKAAERARENGGREEGSK